MIPITFEQYQRKKKCINEDCQKCKQSYDELLLQIQLQKQLEIDKHGAIFLELKTFDEKLEYWKVHLLSLVDLYMGTLSDGRKIRIYPNSREEHFKYNSWIYETLKLDVLLGRKSYFGRTIFKLEAISFQDLTKRFYFNLNKTAFPKQYILDEINRIERDIEKEAKIKRLFAKIKKRIVISDTNFLYDKMRFHTLNYIVLVEQYAEYYLFLKEFDYDKFVEDRPILFANQVKTLFQLTVNRIEDRLKDAPEPKLLIEDRLNEVDKILKDKKYTDFKIPFANGGTSFMMEIEGVTPSESPNHIYKAFNSIIVRNEKNYSYVTYEWKDKDFTSHTGVMAVAYYEFKKYLEDRIHNIEDKPILITHSSKEKINWEQLQKDLIENSFIDPKTKPKALESFFQQQPLKEKIKWIDKAKNHVFTKHTIFVLIEQIKPTLITDSDRNILYSLIEESFLNGDDINYTYNSLKTSFGTWHKRKVSKGYNQKEQKLIVIINENRIK